MKKVIIIRHAKSSWSDFGLSDFDRPLDKRGQHDAPNMASRLRKLGHIPDVIFSSDALRAKTTAGYFAKEFNVALKEIKKLYHGLPEEYLNIINSTSEEFGTVALFGHNPGITIIANSIKKGCTDNVPTCGIIIAQCSLMPWGLMDWHNMDMIDLIYPKDHIDD